MAALPMYDLPWLRPANDLFWAYLAQQLRKRGIGPVPDRLDRKSGLADIWTSPSLLLAQTCGYPLVTGLAGQVQTVATPHYVAEGCDGPFHRAAIVVRQDDPAQRLEELRGRRAGLNSSDSNTGMNLFRAAIAPLARGGSFFASVTVTGSHARSLSAILSHRIDVASIDGVTLALLRDRYPRHSERLKVLEWTPASPALPLISAAGTPPALVHALREILTGMAADPDAHAILHPLRIATFTALPQEAYRPLLALEKTAITYGYAEVR